MLKRGIRARPPAAIKAVRVARAAMVAGPAASALGLTAAAALVFLGTDKAAVG
jgi:hypothetical protein